MCNNRSNPNEFLAILLFPASNLVFPIGSSKYFKKYLIFFVWLQ